MDLPNRLEMLPPPDPKLHKLTARTPEGRAEILAIVRHAIKMGWLTPGSEQAWVKPQPKGAWEWSVKRNGLSGPANGSE